MLDVLAQDLRYAGRGFARHPGFAAVAILSLGIGIGANTAIFSIVNGVLLKPLAYADPDRVFVAREWNPRLSVSPIGVNPMHALTWAEECRSLDGVAVLRGGRAQLTGAGEPVSLPAAQISAGTLTLLGVAPVLGRTFLESEAVEGATPVALLSESLWRSRFNGDPSLVGRAITLDGRDHQVVGIAPDSLRLPYTSTTPRFDVLRPLILPAAERTRPMGNYNYGALVRVKRGAGVERATAEI